MNKEETGVIGAASIQDPGSRIRERSSIRLEALSDGIFAIAMTLLVLDIRPPDDPASIIGLWPHFLCYLISFSLLGIYWSGQAAQYQFVYKVDQAYTWLTLGFLAVIVLVPFSTGFLSKDPFALIPIWTYGINLVIVGLMLFFMWAYAAKGRRLVERNTPAGVVRYATYRCLVAPALYALAMLVSFISPVVSIAIFAITPVPYILPQLHKYWLKLAG